MEENIGTLLDQVSRLMRRDFDQRARAIGVTRPQWQVIALLSHHPGINQCALAELLEVEPITVGRMIDRLQESRMVERRPDPADRRAWRLHLTTKGEDLIEDLRPLVRRTIEHALEGLSAEQILHVTAALERIRGNLSPRVPLDDSPTLKQSIRA